RRLSLDAVAARAGVGIATLYRRFPTREALVDAVYHQELENLCASAEADVTDPAAPPADVALLTWMLRYVEFVDEKRAMGEDLRSLIVAGAVTQTDTRHRLGVAVSRFLDEGIASGIFRADLAADDVVAAMAGAVLGAAGEQRSMQT